MFNVRVDKIIDLLQPAADAAGRTGAYVSLKNVQRAVLLCEINQGNAATVALTPTQATAVAGTGAKAISNNVPIFTDLDTATSDAYTRQTDAKNYTTDAATKRKVVAFLIEPSLALDMANGFDCFTVATGASNAANITAAQLLIEMRYSGEVGNVSVVVD